jgi:hypothetical protein
MTKQEQTDNRLEWEQRAPEGSIPARVIAGQDLTPAERVLAVTLLGLPVQKEAA